MTDNGRLTWTNDKRLLSDLIPWPRNPRQVKVEQVKRLQESLTEFGQPETIVIGPGNELYNGHQRLKSWADKFGDIEVDVRISNRPLTEKEREKLTIFLHKGAAGEWDFDTLANEFDVDDLLDWGFEDHELDLDLWGVEPEPDPGAQIDRAEELRELWGVESGQLWQLGEHRLICGDCTDAEVVARVMDGEKVDAVITDPPYGVGVEYDSFDDSLDSAYKLINKFMPLLLSLNCPIALTSGHRLMWDYPRPAWVMAWIHPAGMGRNPWGFTQFNPILVYGKCPYLARGLGSRPDTIVLAVDREGESIHPTSKPIKVWEWLVERLSPEKDEIIFDPFLGSGTTLIACERLGRKCRAVEISPAYCAVAIQRWVDMTGGEPELLYSESVVRHGEQS